MPRVERSAMLPRTALTALALAGVGVILAGLANAAPAAGGQAAARAALERDFEGTVRPFLTAHCIGCHNKEKARGQLDLTSFATVAAVIKGQRQWETVLEMISTREMPPEDAKSQPSDQLRGQVSGWIQALRRHEAQQNAGDPGPVLARRLSNAEYDYTIRDLLGADLRPTREFPVDPANEAGFDNSGESLAMSPALLKKYVQAARSVAEHLVLQPDGFRFAPFPVVSQTDRDKYGVARIMNFYNRQPTDLATYFVAAWKFRHRAALGQPQAALAEIATAEKVSPKYLATVWSALSDGQESIGPLAKLQAMWNALPAPTAQPTPSPLAPQLTHTLTHVRLRSQTMRDWVVQLRAKLMQKWANLQLKAVGPGSQPFILWKNRQYATHRTSYDRDALYIAGDPGPQGKPKRQADLELLLAVVSSSLQAVPDENQLAQASALALTQVRAHLVRNFIPDPDLAIPPVPAARQQYEAAFARFCQAFPDDFIVSERGRVNLDRPKERADKGRLLSMGGHNMFGFFRDDQPLYQMILDPAGQRELDTLWRELDFVTDAPQRQHADFIFYERAEGPRTIKGPEFDFVRSEDQASTTDPMIRRFAKVYIDKARGSLRDHGGDPRTIPVLEDFFESVSANIQRLERERQTAEPTHLKTLLAFAERAYRRPLSASERDGLLAYYRSLRRRGDGGLSHEEAVRDTVASVLVSPHFLYRIDLLPAGAIAAKAARKAAQPLPGYALASRLSYFLWSSMPDAELLAHAAAGDLDQPHVLAAQARRMLRDERARALAIEFGGNWLDFRRFEEHNSVDRDRFPSCDNDLRRAMFEEPVRFILDVLREDRSVLDFVYGQHTFVNPALAKHYGMPVSNRAPDAWVRVDDASKYGRGGILPMAVFLTKNAPGLRTSPVKRGYWVVRRVLGEHIPPPPAEVPDLPNDERDMGHLTLREVLAKHREDKSCASCHARFDSFGLAFEGYGPIGETRSRDLGGRPVDTRASFPDGRGGKGIDGVGLTGLRNYVQAHRQDDFLDNLCRKLLSYALGRSLILSDDAAIDQMRAQLAADGHRFGSLVTSIVNSRQFLTKRAGIELAQGGN